MTTSALQTTPTPSNVCNLLYAVNCTWQWQLWSRDIHTISRYMYIFNPIFDHPHRTLARWDYHKSYKSKLGWWNTKHAFPQIGKLLFWSITSNSKTGLGRTLQRVNHIGCWSTTTKKGSLSETSLPVPWWLYIIYFMVYCCMCAALDDVGRRPCWSHKPRQHMSERALARLHKVPHAYIKQY